MSRKKPKIVYRVEHANSGAAVEIKMNPGNLGICIIQTEPDQGEIDYDNK